MFSFENIEEENDRIKIHHSKLFSISIEPNVDTVSFIHFIHKNMKISCSKIYDLQNAIELDHYTLKTRFSVVDEKRSSWLSRCSSYGAIAKQPTQSRNRWRLVYILLLFFFFVIKWRTLWYAHREGNGTMDGQHSEFAIVYTDNCLSFSILPISIKSN